MNLTNEQRLARQLYLLELEHKHYKKVVDLIKSKFGKKGDEVLKAMDALNDVSAERIMIQL
jgi:pyruvate/oxaloacetate carboxyltransferase